ncbi:hypothetical protein F5Y10DRAFT_259712 [Nemania abortiva]|nr:hypothetical protein F5Y10DRAFT_259712 [Nemania abortiva]
MSLTLAPRKGFLHLSSVVQDETDDMLNKGQELLTDDARERVSFTKADFLKLQPYKGTAAYLLLQCVHNWADHDVVRMFKAAMPRLESSAPETLFPH